ncbi:serum paraoxonase/arylesterase [Moesziomyces antarcticus]|uniref:Related to serum paraoxonase/arylesterase n=1 Tax=Pseudozyma antarctica TaxID=84753 RepID=A0A5C3FG71_PSEA2|nr:serum paraoxonase/arylesterase [Moesziomyces antarcticus]GAK63104.1 serum paraoxonase/arylesterase [Moesziomyces antarcticus]SPO43412.1 related to serum paraoxonase/arylesterase [Moesziomyces antarcticus]
MPSLLTWVGLPIVLAALAYQFLSGPGSKAHDVFGLGRPLNYTSHGPCTKIPELEACEDMWLHRPSGLLYLACSDIKSRLSWLPAVDNLDVTGRSNTDHIAILDTKGSGPIASRITRVKPVGYTDTLNLHGLSVWEIPAKSPELKPTLRVFVNNHRPPIDPVSKTVVDAKTVGANSTFELFETTLGEGRMRHVRTYAGEAVRTPNRPAAVGPDSFVFTNDHKTKTGKGRILDFFLSRSDLGFCDKSGCKIANPGPFYYPNGLVRSAKFPNRIYVPASADANIRVFELQADNTLTLIDVIHTGYPSDNITVDEDDNIYTASFPNVPKLLAKFKDPENVASPTTVLKISRNYDKDQFFGKKWNVEKLLEDDGSGMSGATTAVWDKHNGGLWLSGVMSVTAFCKV